MVSIGFAGGKSGEGMLPRSRQGTGWIDVWRQCDLVKEIGQTCGRSAAMRPERDRGEEFGDRRKACLVLNQAKPKGAFLAGGESV
jgi:hypothetical protein